MRTRPNRPPCRGCAPNGARCGLVELGVCRQKLPRAQLLQPENVDADALRKMARLIATEVGLPEETKFCDVNPVQLFDFSSLAHISESYPSGSIVQAIDKTLTERRIERMRMRTLETSEFLAVLSRCPQVHEDEGASLTAFTMQITGLEGRLKALGGGKDDGGKGKKKKK